MIPLLGISTANQIDRFKKLIESINFPIKTISIIVNSNYEYFQQIRELSVSSFVEKFEISFCPQNLGFGPSVNHHIKCYPKEDYWVFVEDDVEFGKNDLQQIYELIQTYDGVFCDKASEYILFALNRNMIKKVGFFDENLYPANYEDDDYRNRIMLSEVKVTHFISSCLHNGVAVDMEGGGATGKTLPLEQLNKLCECFKLNEQYYQRKWTSPQSIKINEYLYDIDERAKKEFRI